MLGLTGHVDDDNPLWATMDEDGRIRRLGGAQGGHVTAGLYWLPAQRIAAPTAGFGRLRDYLAWLVDEGRPVYGVALPLVFDIDHARDVEAAEQAGFRLAREGRRMNADLACVGVLREPAHSPGRVEDDAAIMRRVGEALSERGFRVELIAADALTESTAANLFIMCERGAVLDRLAAMEKAGSVVVNAPGAIRNTYRHRMVELFARHRVPAPVSWVVATDANKPRPADCAWVKRYDFHATQRDDVMYAASETGWREALRRFAERGIPFVVAQEHVAGDLVKFYGVRNSAGTRDADWFQWFYHRDKGMLGHAFDPARLSKAALAAAAALGLEIFGGDAVIQANGEPMIIDLNAWPSYALYRDRAAAGDRRLPGRALPAAPAPGRLSKELIR